MVYITVIMNGKELRGIRSLLRWTQGTMALHVGLSTNTIARQERGEVTIGEPEARLIYLLYEQNKTSRKTGGRKSKRRKGGK
jgi:DNA-binding XRE family transcriptional regulator